MLTVRADVLPNTKSVALRINRSRPWRVMTSLAVLLVFARTRSQEVTKAEDQQTSVTGIIRLVRGYGPPGYGETPKHDLHVTYWALEVPIPVNLPCTPEKPQCAKYDCASAKRLKLFFPDPPATPTAIDAQTWKDKPVVITGKLHRADTLGEMTKIYMDVKTIMPKQSH